MAATKPKASEPIKVTHDAKGRARYKVRIRVAGGDSGSGQKFASGTFDSLSDARAFVDETRTARRKGDVAVSSKIRFREYAGKWIESVERSGVRATTVTSYKTHVNTANRAFGDIALSKITRQDVEALVADYAARGRSITSSAYLLRQLRVIFREAQEDGIIPRNPAARVKAQGAPKCERDALTSAELAKVRRVLRSDPDWALWLLTLSGLRRGEVMGLRWSDLDLKVGTVTIARSRVKHGVGGVAEQVGKPKTRNGERTLYIAEMPELVSALRDLRDGQLANLGGEQARSGYLAVDEFGQPLAPTRWSRRWEGALAEAGVRSLTLHAARHTAVTMMRDAGVPDHIVAAWVGHDETIMRGVYTHARAEQMTDAGARLSESLG